MSLKVTHVCSGHTQSVLGHILRFEHRLLDATAQSLDSVALIRQRLARELSGGLEESQARVQTPAVFVNLKEHFIVFEVLRPLAVGLRIERLTEEHNNTTQNEQKKV